MAVRLFAFTVSAIVYQHRHYAILVITYRTPIKSTHRSRINFCVSDYAIGEICKLHHTFTSSITIISYCFFSSGAYFHQNFSHESRCDLFVLRVFFDCVVRPATNNKKNLQNFGEHVHSWKSSILYKLIEVQIRIGDLISCALCNFRVRVFYFYRAHTAVTFANYGHNSHCIYLVNRTHFDICRKKVQKQSPAHR